MASDELKKSWKRTEGFLLDERSNLSEVAEWNGEKEICKFDEFIQHNELELALDALERAFDKSDHEALRILELMALAAASMGLFERQRRYDDRLSKARGWKYETVLKI